MVADGKLTPTGQKEIKMGKDKEIAKFEVQEETTDAYGNVIKVCQRWAVGECVLCA